MLNKKKTKANPETIQGPAMTRRSLIRSVVGVAAGGAAMGVLGTQEIFASTPTETNQCIDHGRLAPVQREPLALDITPRRLQRGDMLITDQYNARVYLVRDRQVLPFIDVHSWGRSHLWDAITSADRKRVYISMSGLRGPNLDYVGIKGLGAILEVDPETGEILRVFSSVNENGWPNHKAFIDVTGMAITADGKHLLVNDFVGFAHRGMVLRFDLENNGTMKVFTDGLMEPSGMTPDGPGHVLIGNARMPGGAELGGEVVRLNVQTGEKEVLFNVNLTTGAMIGVLRLDDGTLIGSISDWPDQKKSQIIRIDGPDKYQTLLSPELAFFSAQLAPDLEEGFWVAESVTRTLYRLNKQGEVLETLNVDPCTHDGQIQPLTRAFDTLESVRLVA